MLVLIFYVLPIIIIDCFAYYDMQHGQTLKEYVEETESHVPAMFTFVPVVNFIVLIVVIGCVLWHFIGNIKKK